MKVGQLDIDLEWVREFSERHRLAEFSIFGSALRDDFRPDSDVDVLYELLPNTPSTIEQYLEMKDELEAAFGRDVDVVQKRCVRNPFRRYEILTTRRKLYARPPA